MIDHVSIRQSLRSRLLTISGLPLKRSWENRGFEPPNPPAQYVRETYLPGEERLVASGQVMAVGMIQWDIFEAAREGTESVESLADLVKETFKPGTSLDSLVQVFRSERDNGRQDSEWYWIPVRVSWRAFSTV